jgi:hypothetical protein
MTMGGIRSGEIMEVTAKTPENSDGTLLDHGLAFILLFKPYIRMTEPNVYNSTSANVVTAVAPRTA